jgi:hypothetical protein
VVLLLFQHLMAEHTKYYKIHAHLYGRFLQYWNEVDKCLLILD